MTPLRHLIKWLQLRLQLGFALTDLEEDLIAFLRSQLTEDCQEILDDQLRRMTTVRRFFDTKAEDASEYSYTELYRMRFGRSSRDFPKRFPVPESARVLARVRLSAVNVAMDVEFRVIKGSLSSIRYFPEGSAFRDPERPYELKLLSISACHPVTANAVKP
jgi:hypothetical protein